MIRICVVCGKEFKCSPSDKKMTCSKECSRINKSRTHQGKKNTWSEESREKLRQKGRTSNLEKGTEANAKIWKLTSPEGKVYIVKNLAAWSRENCMLFGFDNNEANAQKIMYGLRHAKHGSEGKVYARTTLYKGWIAESATKEDYRLFEKYKDSDLSILTEKQRVCLIMRMNGISIQEIAKKCNIQRTTVYQRLKSATRVLDGLPVRTEREKDYAKKYYQEHKDSIKPQIREYYESHKERYKELQDKWYQEHKEELKESKREYNKKYYQENRERLLNKAKERQRDVTKLENSPGE